MELNEEMEMRLWEYIDDVCSEAMRQDISRLIAGDRVWKQRYEELMALHKSISGSMEQEQPSLRFSKNVMDAIAEVKVAPATKKYINRSIIRGIAAFFIITITVMIGYAVAATSRSTSTSGISSTTDPVFFDLGNMLNSSTFSMLMAVNAVLALVFLDVLLRRKRAQQ